VFSLKIYSNRPMTVDDGRHSVRLKEGRRRTAGDGRRTGRLRTLHNVGDVTAIRTHRMQLIVPQQRSRNTTTPRGSSPHWHRSIGGLEYDESNNLTQKGFNCLQSKSYLRENQSHYTHELELLQMYVMLQV